MSKEPELKARDKVVVRMTREGAVEENLTAGTEQRVSKRLEDAELVKPVETAAPSRVIRTTTLSRALSSGSLDIRFHLQSACRQARCTPDSLPVWGAER